MKKICRGCGRNRRIERFGKLSASADGRNYYCRECMRVFNKNYKTSTRGILKQRKYSRKWKIRNKEHVREYNKTYYVDNKDRILYNKKCRDETECILITETSEKQQQKKISKDRRVCIIEINPKRK